MSFFSLILFGAPGCGKGTQSKLIAQYYNLFHLSTGDLLREVKNDETSPFHTQIANKMAKGELVGDDILFAIVSSKISLVKKDKEFKGIIFDGFPRNILQAEFLEKELKSNEIALRKAIFFEISPEVVVDRILNRFTCKKCGAVYNRVSKKPMVEGVCDACGAINSFSDRSDDTPEVIKNRLRIFEENMKPLRKFYENSISEVDASQDPEEVFNNIKKILEK